MELSNDRVKSRTFKSARKSSGAFLLLLLFPLPSARLLIVLWLSNRKTGPRRRVKKSDKSAGVLVMRLYSRATTVYMKSKEKGGTRGGGKDRTDANPGGAPVQSWRHCLLISPPKQVPSYTYTNDQPRERPLRRAYQRLSLSLFNSIFILFYFICLCY